MRDWAQRDIAASNDPDATAAELVRAGWSPRIEDARHFVEWLQHLDAEKDRQVWRDKFQHRRAFKKNLTNGAIFTALGLVGVLPALQFFTGAREPENEGLFLILLVFVLLSVAFLVAGAINLISAMVNGLHRLADRNYWVSERLLEESSFEAAYGQVDKIEDPWERSRLQASKERAKREHK